jgi:three-Cys-motif partner protein
VWLYIDGFAGAGEHRRKGTHETVVGSPLLALDIAPPFREYFFVDLDGDKIGYLKERVGARPDVHTLEGDCNKVLLNEVFPRVKYKDFRRALCLLDPYGLDLSWEVIEAAGRLKTIDLFLNFPIMDANRNALWHDPERVSPDQAARLTRYWGDESWRSIALRRVAGSANVPDPLPMKNNQGAVVYYLYFASQKDVANKIVMDVFLKHSSRRG